MKYLIYALADPRSGQWRYIGRSSSGLKRPRRHRWLARRGEASYKANWIRQLLAAGLEYQIVVLEAFASTGGLAEAERDWIAAACAVGVELTNLTLGGEEVRSWKQQASAAKQRGVPKSASWRANISAGLKGKKKSLAHCAKLKAACALRQPISSETKAKLSLAGQNRRHTPEDLAKMRGRKHTAEELEKMRAKSTGRRHDEKTRARLREVALQRPRGKHGWLAPKT